ncbi:MAG: 1-phosphofructokinase family hexose kinase [Bacteroidetes bacterium]|nr:MAG: 1-phosphofructokinase family hexose kinase [Bacteroidota bacterium]
MPSIVTITFNPCLDISSSVDALLPEKKMRCAPLVYEAGGGGINVARGIKKLGGNPLAIYLAGGNNGATLQSLLEAESLDTVLIDTGINTRVNVTMVDKSSTLQYRFITAGNPINEISLEKCIRALEELSNVEYIVVSGSLQTGLPHNIFERLSAIAKQKKAKLIIDAPTEVLKTYPIKGAYLLKPNLNELSMLAGKEELQDDEIIDVARIIISRNVCEVVVISMGPAGALLVTKDITERFITPMVKAKTTVGAGDSMVAGIVMHLASNKDIKEAVRFGVACGTAATLNEGTQLFKIEDAEKLYRAIRTL